MFNSNTRLKYKRYISEDAKANNRTSVRSKIFGDEIWKFIRRLRKMEYYDELRNEGSLIGRLLFVLCYFRYRRISIKLGYSIPYKTKIGKGLCLPHYGTIVISDNAIIGDYCKIHVGVNIGSTAGKFSAPKIGNYVYIGPGVKIVGDISVADNVVLGAGCVVVKSIEEEATTWAGVPAKKISDNSSKAHLSSRIYGDNYEKQ